MKTMKSKKMFVFLDVIIISLIILVIGGTIIAWSNSPSVIPNHLDSMGNIKDYMTRNFLFFPSAIGVIISIIILILSRYPNLYNYVVEIIDDNKERQYFLAGILGRVLNIEVLLIFAYMEYCIIMVKSCTIGMGILTIIMIFTLWYYGREAKKIK